MGTLRHDLFERCLFYKNFSVEFAATQCSSIIRNHAETLIGMGMLNESEIHSDLMKTLPLLQSFASEYTSFYPASPGNSDFQGAIVAGHGIQPSVHIAVDEVHATEESSVSHELGLKGFIDATVEIRGTNSPSMLGDSLPPKSLVAIELKTGHNQNAQHAHMAQLALYTGMLRARYGSAKFYNERSGSSCTGDNGAAGSGILLYLNHQSHRAVHIVPSDGDIKSLINQRNVVATEIRRSLKPRGLGIASDENDMNNANDVHKTNRRGRCVTLSFFRFTIFVI